MKIGGFKCICPVRLTTKASDNRQRNPSEEKNLKIKSYLLPLLQRKRQKQISKNYYFLRDLSPLGRNIDLMQPLQQFRGVTESLLKRCVERFAVLIEPRTTVSCVFTIRPGSSSGGAQITGACACACARARGCR